ncbi:MAG: FMN-binding protein [Treponema sp.]|nr:FMN-binding protein [Treponema sp.]
MKTKGIWILALIILFAGCLSSEAGYTPGIYEGTGRGYRGPIHVRLQTSPAGIEYIAIVSHRESAFPGTAAMEELLEAILEYGSTDLDAVSGATFSSRGFLEAVEDALKKARL